MSQSAPSVEAAIDASKVQLAIALNHDKVKMKNLGYNEQTMQAVYRSRIDSTIQIASQALSTIQKTLADMKQQRATLPSHYETLLPDELATIDSCIKQVQDHATRIADRLGEMRTKAQSTSEWIIKLDEPKIIEALNFCTHTGQDITSLNTTANLYRNELNTKVINQLETLAQAKEQALEDEQRRKLEAETQYERERKQKEEDEARARAEEEANKRIEEELFDSRMQRYLVGVHAPQDAEEVTVFVQCRLRGQTAPQIVGCFELIPWVHAVNQEYLSTTTTGESDPEQKGDLKSRDEKEKAERKAQYDTPQKSMKPVSLFGSPENIQLEQIRYSSAPGEEPKAEIVPISSNMLIPQFFNAGTAPLGIPGGPTGYTSGSTPVDEAPRTPPRAPAKQPAPPRNPFFSGAAAKKDVELPAWKSAVSGPTPHSPGLAGKLEGRIDFDALLFSYSPAQPRPSAAAAAAPEGSAAAASQNASVAPGVADKGKPGDKPAAVAPAKSAAPAKKP